MLVPFAPPQITPEDIAAVTKVLLSGWITTGGVTQKFEDEIAHRTDSAGCVCFSSATAALELALRLLGIGEGDEVILPAYTYAATANAVLHVGAVPVLADCLPGSYHIGAETILPLVTPKTKAVIPVDVGGILCDYGETIQALEGLGDFTPNNELSEKIGRIAVIADAAHSFGAYGTEQHPQPDFIVYSFHAVKNLTTAEGGALCWRSVGGISNGEIDRLLRLWSLHGQSKSAFAKAAPGNWEYDIELPGYKCNLTDIHAALGFSQLARYDETLKRRGEACAFYDELLRETSIRPLGHFAPSVRSSYHLYITDTGLPEEARNQVISKMAQAGVAANVHFKPLPLFTAYSKMGWDAAQYPNAMERYRGEITLPLFGDITKAQIVYTTQTYCNALNELHLPAKAGEW